MHANQPTRLDVRAVTRPDPGRAWSCAWGRTRRRLHVDRLESRRLLSGGQVDDVFAWPTSPINAAPFVTATADFDGNGLLDIAGGDQINGDGVISLAFNGGGALATTFGAEATLPVSGILVDIAAADFDGDGSTDLAALRFTNPGNAQYSVRLFLNTGTGSFTVQDVAVPAEQLSDVRAITALDVNGDDRPDLVYNGVAENSNTNLGTLQIFLQNPDGTFTQDAQGLDVGDVEDLITADLDRDGADDLVLARDGEPGLILFNAPGSSPDFFDGSIVLDQEFERVAVAHLDGDNAPDLVGLAGQLSVLTFFNIGDSGNDERAFAAAELQATSVAASNVTAIDLDGDGVDDLALQDDQSSGVFRNDLATGGGFTEVRSLDLGRSSSGQDRAGFIAADFDNDGDPDLVMPRLREDTGAARFGDYVFLENVGGSIIGPEIVTADDDVDSLTTADFNNDGRDDLLVGVSSDSLIALIDDGSGGFISRVVVPAQTSWGDSLAVDFNNDGLLDVAALTGTSVALAIQNPNGSFQPQLSLVVNTSISELLATDVTGDGFADILVSTPANASVRLYINDGSGGFDGGLGTGTDAITGIQASSIAVGDFDGDATPDLALLDGSTGGTGQLVLATGNGDGTFTAESTRFVGTATDHLTLTDLDGDGITELLLLDRDDDKLRLLPGSPARTYTTLVDYNTGRNPLDLTVEDFTGDGVPDVVVANGFFGRDVGFYRGLENNRLVTQRRFAVEDTAVAVHAYDDGESDLPGLAVATSNNPEIQLFGNVLDRVAPSIAQADFLVEGLTETSNGPAVSILFDEPIAPTTSAASFVLENLTTGETIGLASVGANVFGPRLDLDFAGLALPDGNYRLTLPAGAIRDTAGNATTTEQQFDFFVLAGDANRDRRVDLQDFLTLRMNFGMAGLFSDGDFDYSGSIDLQDFLILRGNFNVSLPGSENEGRSLFAS